MKKIEHEKYGVITTTCLVIGIVIGSGIFFKADDILLATGGSVILAVLGFLFVGIGVLFGALTLSYYAQQGSDEGGMIAYSKTAWGHNFGFIIGWFMTVAYIPALVVILANVTAIYFLQLIPQAAIFGEASIWVFTTLFIIISFTSNVLNAKFAGKILNIATFIKLLPILAIIIAGVFFHPATASQNLFDVSAIATGDATISGFLKALIAIAFAYDGWIVATSVSSEIKNSKKNLPKALTFGVIGIVVIYTLYFVGITVLVDPATIMQVGDAHASIAANKLLPGIGETLMLICICISVYGGLNGMTLGFLRLPHALVSNGLMKNVINIDKINPKYDLSIGSLLFGLPFVVLFLILHIVSTVGFGEFTWLMDIGFDISAFPITVIYIFYIALYIGAAKFVKQGLARKIIYLYITLAVLIA
ncbi:MAG: APC family permease, partial [Mycoplasmatales bacterium]